jgi:hypothetical protein
LDQAWRHGRGVFAAMRVRPKPWVAGQPLNLRDGVRLKRQLSRATRLAVFGARATISGAANGLPEKTKRL